MNINLRESGRGVAYPPFRNYRLPEIVRVHSEDREPRDAPIQRRDGTVTATHGLYALKWPGWRWEDNEHTNVHWDMLRHFVPQHLLEAHGLHQQSHIDLADLVQLGLLPERVPEELAYHLAVNYDWYGDDGLRDVAGIPRQIAVATVQQVFALPEGVLPTLNYLKWMAESHKRHPLFGYGVEGLDTMHRENLQEVTQTAALLYFRTLGDFSYDATAGYWSRGADKRWWPYFAAYLHWVGRTGQGLYDDHSGLWTNQSWRHKLIEEFPQVVEGLMAWNAGAMDAVRQMTGLQESGSVEGPAIS